MNTETLSEALTAGAKLLGAGCTIAAIGGVS